MRRDTKGEIGHVTTKSENGVIQLRAKEQQDVEEAREDPPLEPSEGALKHLDSDFWPPKLETIEFCCLQPFNLWYFGMAALGN